MQCPRCGAGSFMRRDIGFIEGMECRCYQCGFRWIQMGRTQSGFEFERKLRDLWETNKVYGFHGLVIWLIASGMLFLLTMRNPISAFLNLGDGWLIFMLTVLLAGIFLGVGISTSLLIGGRYWPNTKAVHIILPLAYASLVGVIQGLLWASPEFILSHILQRSQLVIIAGVLLGLISTPIIIIRSSNVLRRKGLRPDLIQPKDDRWRC